MKKVKKISQFERRILIFRLLTISQNKRADFLKKKNIFFEFGSKVKWGSVNIPSEPYLVKIGNNVRIAANVTFITHDIITGLLKNNADIAFESQSDFYMGTITVNDNVMIGANSTIMYNVTIGPNAIIAAGSVVVSDVPAGSIVGGNPAKVIGNYYDLAKRRALFNKVNNKATIEEIIKDYWGK